MTTLVTILNFGPYRLRVSAQERAVDAPWAADTHPFETRVVEPGSQTIVRAWNTKRWVIEEQVE